MTSTAETSQSDPAGIDLVYWPVGLVLAGLPFAEHLKIAAAGGFTSLAVSPMSFKQLGLTAAQALDLAGEHGLKFTQLDGITTWVKNWYPVVNDSAGNQYFRTLFDVPMEEALDIAQSLRMTSVVGVGFFDEGSMEVAEITDHFGTFCDAAKQRGLNVDLEFIPGWGIPELPLAWQIVSAAGRENAGLCVDTWHLQIGSSDFERDMALLAQIPGRYLQNVQIVDADLRMRTEPFTMEAVTRKFAGEGELAITRILALIAAKNGLAHVGPEIVGARLAGLTAAAHGEVAGQTTRAALNRADAANGKPPRFNQAAA